MKETIIDIREMSDSKEVYGRRPNAIIPIFIFILVGLLIIGVVYCCIAKIEIVTRANGVVRPNDNISSISSLIGGRITGVYYTGGQLVQKGDILLEIDTSEQQILLNGYQSTKEDYEKQIVMLGKFADGIRADSNPFSSDPDGEEYTYYVQYQNYELTKQNTDDTHTYDVETVNSHIYSLNIQIKEIENRVSGMTAYKNSIEQGKSLVASYPEFEKMYQLYVANKELAYSEYLSQQNKIQNDSSAENIACAIDTYQTQLEGYNALVSSVEQGSSVFPENDTSTYRLLFDDFINGMLLHEQAYQTAADLYNYYINAGGNSWDDQVIEAKKQMDNAAAALRVYKTDTLSEYKKVQLDLQSKIRELSLSASNIQDKAAALAALDQSYENSESQRYLQTITQIDASLQSLHSELLSAQSSLRLYQLASNTYSNNSDDNGNPKIIMIAVMEQLSGILAKKENLEQQLLTVETQLQQVKAQVEQGTIKAEQDGIVNEVTALSRGDILSVGTVFATIIPDNESEYKVQLYLSNADIANVKMGDAIKYNLAALPSNQFGVIEGVVSRIPSDALYQANQLSGYYLIEGSIGTLEVSDRDGNTRTIAAGMQLEAKIVIREKTIMRYLLEKTNLF